MFIQWNLNTILFTKMELLRMHRNFFHPSAKNLYNVLKRGFALKCTVDVKNNLEKIIKQRLHCQQRSTPHRFKVCLPPDKIVFNGIVVLYMLWLNIKGKRKKVPALHIVDIHTHFQNAIFLKSESSRHIWDGFVEAWASVYIGYPRI